METKRTDSLKSLPSIFYLNYQIDIVSILTSSQKNHEFFGQCVKKGKTVKNS